MIIFSHIAIMVDDLDAMEKFYTSAFLMRTVWKQDGVKAYLTTGNGDILGLLTGTGPAQPRSAVDLSSIDPNAEETPSFFHFGVVVTRTAEFDDTEQRLRQREVDVIGPRVSRDGTRSLYCQDPEGNAVQVTYVPESYFAAESD